MHSGLTNHSLTSLSEGVFTGLNALTYLCGAER